MTPHRGPTEAAQRPHRIGTVRAQQERDNGIVPCVDSEAALFRTYSAKDWSPMVALTCHWP
jgi:hypothetical protein